MRFNSSLFLFAFLPFVLLVFLLLSRRGARLPVVGWLVLSSIFFYGWWNPEYLILIAASVVVNFVLGNAGGARASPVVARAVVIIAVSLNLALLGYYKYANFFLAQAASLTGRAPPIGEIALPLAISFFTFQQIAYQVDIYRGEAARTRFLDYCLFVTFFPQLISGPIVHHREMLPQFERPGGLRSGSADLAVGLTILVIGYFKKAVLADGMAAHSSPIYDAVARGQSIHFFTAWVAALGYSLQLYFDFSGYSDMAIGLGRMFGVRLPLNFHSPYKAVSIIEFWRRWHTTLSRFLRNYLYIPLGGNRRGSARRYVNLMITMLLGGLWHGAGWTFLVWGGMHGVYLMINHAWIAFKRRVGVPALLPAAVGRPASGGLTFVAVVAAFVLFRSQDVGVSREIIQGMLGMNGLRAPTGLGSWTAIGWVAALLAIVWLLPNTQQLLRRHQPALDVYDHLARARPGRIEWEPTWWWGCFVSVLLLTSLYFMMVEGHEEFLYRLF